MTATTHNRAGFEGTMPCRYGSRTMARRFLFTGTSTHDRRGRFLSRHVTTHTSGREHKYAGRVHTILGQRLNVYTLACDTRQRS